LRRYKILIYLPIVRELDIASFEAEKLDTPGALGQEGLVIYRFFEKKSFKRVNAHVIWKEERVTLHCFLDSSIEHSTYQVIIHSSPLSTAY
jgi:hypothetical protein